MARSSTAAERVRLHQAPTEEIVRLVEQLEAALDPPALRQLFANPFLDGRQIAALLDLPAVEGQYEARRAAVGHPRTPLVTALRFVPGLYWVDLVRIGLDMRLHPVVRRAADQRIVDRLPTLAVGERVAIAKQGSSTVLAALRNDPTPQVIAALLDNPRTTEALLLPLAASEASHPQALAVVARSARWATRPVLRAALARNPSLPAAVALTLLVGLSKRDLAAVSAEPRLAQAVRRKAALLGSSELRSPGRGRSD